MQGKVRIKCRRETKGKDSKEGRTDTRQEKGKVVRKDGRKLLHRGADEER